MLKDECIKKLTSTTEELISAYDELQMVATTYYQTWQDAYRNADANSDAAARRIADAISFPERQAMSEVETEIKKLQEQRDYYRTVLPHLKDSLT